MGELSYAFLLLLPLQLSIVGADHSVYILSENLEQTVTSTTLEWVPSGGYNASTLNNAVVAAYQSFEEPRKNEPTDDGADDTSVEIVNKPVYVCRAKSKGRWIPGQLRPKKSVCVVSLYKKVTEYADFEILVSIEGSSRLSWVKKDKYSLISQGAVTSGEIDLESYVARRPANSHNKDGSLTHIVGTYVHSINLGVFYLVDQNNNEMQYEDGEILVETEPIRYEIKQVVYEKSPRRFPKTLRELGRTILKNEEDSAQHVASVISYNYDYSLNWGKGHGLLTGLPFTVDLPEGTRMQGEWSLTREEERSEIAPVKKYLQAGTAVNVSVFGNYTEAEIPYTARVVAIYKDGETKEITIRDSKREHRFMDVVAIYSPVYFIHNNSHVPTTTTTTAATTSGTSSTTSKTTSTTAQEVVPIPSPEVVTTHTVDKYSRKHDTSNMLSDQQNMVRHNASVGKSEVPVQPDGVPPMGVLSAVTILMISLVIVWVT